MGGKGDLDDSKKDTKEEKQELVTLRYSMRGNPGGEVHIARMVEVHRKRNRINMGTGRITREEQQIAFTSKRPIPCNGGVLIEAQGKKLYEMDWKFDAVLTDVAAEDSSLVRQWKKGRGASRKEIKGYQVGVQWGELDIG